MWKTFQIWFLMNKSLHYHPFNYLSALKPSPRRKRKSKAQIIFLGILGVVAYWLILQGGFRALWDMIVLLGFVLFAGGLQIILIITATSGIFMAGKIVNRISLIEKLGIYDLIAITPNGGEKSRWDMGRIAYQNTRWLKVAEWILFIGSLIFIFITSLQGDNIILSLLALNLWFIQQLVMGYLVGMLCSSLKTDVTNRVFVSIGLTNGIQIGIAITTVSILGWQLYRLFFRMGWDINILPLVQLFGFLVLLEIMVRVLLRLIARLSGLPYHVWRAEVRL